MSLEVTIKKRLNGFSLDVSFDTADGALGILGASGSGKSMTLRCIAGIETPDSGRICLNGRVLFDSEKKINLKPQQRKIGYLFQNYALFPHMTVSENICCSLSLLKAEKQRKTAELCALFRLQGLENMYPAQLSGGQQQRVAAARMLAADPDALLLDEPFSALDSYLRERLQLDLWELLAPYKGDIVLVTHSRDEVYRLCDRLMIVENGVSVLLGGTKDLFSDPQTVAAAKLTGCKNISRAKKIGPHEIEALDWGITLKISGNSPEDISYVGIRAHDFKFCENPDSFENVIPVRILKQFEDPFELNIMFENAAAPSPDSLKSIWWKCPKNAFYTRFPPFLRIDCENVLPLKD